MSAGIQINLAEINNTAGSLARGLFSVMANIGEFKAWLDGLSAQNLVDNYGMVIGDANDLKSAFTEMGDLAAIWNGQASANLTGTHAYQTFPRRLIGTGLY